MLSEDIDAYRKAVAELKGDAEDAHEELEAAMQREVEANRRAAHLQDELNDARAQTLTVQRCVAASRRDCARARLRALHAPTPPGPPPPAGR